MKKNKIFLIFFAFININFAQYEVKDSVNVIPGIEYQSNWIKELFFGKHWRDVWTTEIKVPILNLETFAGGLKPIKLGGGMATKSLRFIGNDNKYWKFRTVNKDPSNVLPEELRKTKIADIVKDQTSSSLPLAPMVVSELLRAINVLFTEPILYQMPSSDLLGEYNSIFENQLGFIEEHPDEDGAGFYDAKKILGTFKLFNRLEKKIDEKIDSKEFLKIRLIDILIGDWDRHTDQWRWALYENENKKIWRPIPRDRDQAFAKFDGLFPKIAEYMIPQFTNFSSNYPVIEDLTWSGRFLDRRILNSLSFEEWIEVTEEVIKNISVDVIANAVKQLPTPVYDKIGNSLFNDLNERKNYLLKASKEYYYILNKYVDIYGTSNNDSLFIDIKDKYTSVNLNSGNEVIYKKEIDNSTREIRVYLNDGDDITIVSGNTEYSPIIRVIGEDGKDCFNDFTLNTKSIFHKLVNGEKLIFYDSGKKSIFNIGNNSTYKDYFYPKPENDLEKYEPELNDRGHDWMIYPLADYSTDNGLILGAGPRLYKHGFRTSPYVFSQTLTLEYAFKLKSVRLKYSGEFYRENRRGNFNIDAGYSTFMIFNYFGYGNLTEYDRHLEYKGFYQVEQELFFINPSYCLPIINNDLKLRLGADYTSSVTKLINKDLISDFENNENGLGIYRQISSYIKLDYNKKDSEYLPMEGLQIINNIKYSPDLFNENNYLKYTLDIRKYISFNLIKRHSLALRFGYEKLWGNFPYFEAAFLGGKNNLRGYSNGRFSGSSSIFYQTEVRLSLLDMKIIVPSKVGINIFYESGRVYRSNESQNKWHNSYGMGIWTKFFEDEYTFGLSLATSEERNVWYFNIGLGF